MKRFLVVLAMAGSVSGLTYAQEVVESMEVVEVPTDKYVVQTNKFWNNWFVSVPDGCNCCF